MKHRHTSAQKSFQPIAKLIAIGILGLAIVILVIWQLFPPKAISTFRECKDAGGSIQESYPEKCTIRNVTYSNPDQAITEPGYVGLSEQAALDRAKTENKAVRVVERDSEQLQVTTDFSEGGLNLYVKNGTVYKVILEE